jgi:divalent metal cation (Fe/Co/Zn/Cd) transporter
MERWLKYGLIAGVIGIVLYLLLNFVPLIIGILTNSQSMMAISNINVSYNIIRIMIYFIVGFVLGALISLMFKKKD